VILGLLARWLALGLARPLLAGAFGIALAAAISCPVLARTAKEAKALVERAAAHVQAVGQKQAFADITRPDGDFVDGELYVFCDAADGTVLAHGDNPRLVGKNLSAVRDATGKRPFTELFRLAQTQGQGWAEYLWPNAATGRIQHKMTYVVRIDDRTICASGHYEPDPP
jgi:signal transduction histidine kinase